MRLSPPYTISSIHLLALWAIFCTGVPQPMRKATDTGTDKSSLSVQVNKDNQHAIDIIFTNKSGRPVAIDKNISLMFTINAINNKSATLHEEYINASPDADQDCRKRLIIVDNNPSIKVTVVITKHVRRTVEVLSY